LASPDRQTGMGGEHFWVPIHAGAASGVSVAGDVLTSPAMAGGAR
jgi:hypothetical protein